MNSSPTLRTKMYQTAYNGYLQKNSAMPKTGIKAENILKIADIESVALHPDTQVYFKTEAQPAWRDQMMNEHIYHVETLIENLQDDEQENTVILKDLESLQRLVTNRNCGYVRITY